jgi:hypothetical protein
MSNFFERSFDARQHREVRWTFMAACVAAVVIGGAVGAAGCFSPDIKSGGFTCVATDDPPCPSGFFCVNGLCVDTPGADSGDMASPDLAQTTYDLASTDLASGTGDMAKLPGDMTMCGAPGGICTKATDCCSGACFLLVCL